LVFGKLYKFKDLNIPQKHHVGLDSHIYILIFEELFLTGMRCFIIVETAKKMQKFILKFQWSSNKNLN